MHELRYLTYHPGGGSPCLFTGEAAEPALFRCLSERAGCQYRAESACDDEQHRVLG